MVSPIEVLVTGPDAGNSAGRVVEEAERVPGVAGAFAPTDGQWRKGDAALVDVIAVDETVDSSGAGIVDDIQAGIEDVPGVVGLSGTGPTIQDYIDAVYKNFPYTLALIALITFILLVRPFRSIILPLKAVLLNIISVAATFGATVLFWQQGHGSEQIFDIQATGAVTFWLPILIFAFLFGLSMDYEVFILARMREEYDKTGNTNAAVIEGLARTGRLVTGAAMILFLSFVALASGPGTDLKVFATALGLGIPARRHDRARAAGAGAGLAVRRVELVPTCLGCQAAPAGATPPPTEAPRGAPGRRGRRAGPVAAGGPCEAQTPPGIASAGWRLAGGRFCLPARPVAAATVGADLAAQLRCQATAVLAPMT